MTNLLKFNHLVF